MITLEQNDLKRFQWIFAYERSLLTSQQNRFNSVFPFVSKLEQNFVVEKSLFELQRATVTGGWFFTVRRQFVAGDNSKQATIFNSSKRTECKRSEAKRISLAKALLIVAC